MIAAVVEFLEQQQYARRPEPLHVCDDAFEFDAVLEGPGGTFGLVLVAQAVHVPTNSLMRRLQTLLLVLERSGSTRPISLVLVGEVSRAELEDLGTLCRVVSVDGRLPIHAALLGLLPIAFIPPSTPVDADQLLADRLQEIGDGRGIRRLLKCADTSADAVEREFLTQLEAALRSADEETP